MKKTLVAFGFLLASLILVSQCHAQINATFKSARSFNADSTTVRNEVNTLVSAYDSVGALYYNTQSSPAKWRVFESGTWKDLTAGPHAGLYWPLSGANNLTGAFQMTYTGAKTHNFFMNDTAWRGTSATGTESTLISSEGTNAIMSKSNSIGGIFNYVNIADTGIEFEGVGFSANSNELVYSSSGNELQIGSSATNKSELRPDLFILTGAGGNTAYQDAGQTSSQSYTITTGNSLVLNPASKVLTVGSVSSAGNMTIQTESSDANANLTILPKGATGDIIFTSNSQTLRLDGNAAEYGADYRATYNNRSLVDKGYLVDAIGSLQVKVVNIGDWDMNISVGGTATVNVAHGLVDYKQIRAIEVVIRDDSDATYYDLDQYAFATGTMSGGVAGFDTTNITLATSTGGTFDNLSFDALTYNRGFVTIWYVNSF